MLVLTNTSKRYIFRDYTQQNKKIEKPTECLAIQYSL